MGEYRFAQEFRDIIRQIVRKVIRDEVPSLKMGKVYSVDSVRQLAWILFPNETIDNLVKVHCAADKIPTKTMDSDFAELGYDAPGDLVRVWGKPGSLFILDYYSGVPSTLDLSTSGETAAQGLSIVRFTDPQSNTVWPIPVGVKAISYEAVSAAGGGASGRRGAADTVRCGGGAGSGGNRVTNIFLTEELTVSSLFITVGAGGAGGVGITENDTDGFNGSDGGLSAIRTSTAGSDSTQTICVAGGGHGGLAGTATSGNGGSSPESASWMGGDGGSASIEGGVNGGTITGAPSIGAGPGGGAGAGLTEDNLESDGGTGGFAGGGFNQHLAGGVAPGGDGLDGGDNAVLSPGQAGSGGASDVSGPGGDGGNGGRAAGGGGGAASLNGHDSGAGGDGGNGYIVLTVYT